MTAVCRSHVPWSRQANLYQVNLRQYTPEGTFRAFMAHLPRLQAMGVSMLWLMPIHPVGQRQRKGRLGSAYAVRDHLAVNPDFGTLADFKALVDAAHAAGMRVLLDWVANHTAWDHVWATAHPHWYKRNAAGELTPCEYHNGRETEYWTDVVALDYAQPELWAAMTDALCWWVRETGIDGYRCDVASLVPTPFWAQARDALDAIQPVFMLAESADVALHRRAFDMTYDWALNDALAGIAAGEYDVNQLVDYLDRRQAEFPADAIGMAFTSNHDKNAWEGHDGERFGDAFRVCAVLAATLPGLPLIYSGQEAFLDKRLAFFERDPIDWKAWPLAGFYSGLLRLKHDNPALANGAAGAAVELLDCSSRHVLAFRRSLPGNSVTVLANLSAQPRSVYTDAGAAPVPLAPWGWHISASRLP